MLSAVLHLDDQVLCCRACNLRATCVRPVPGHGPLPAGVLVVGRDPGLQEDLQGVPFVGDCGRWLDDFLADCGLHRDCVRITNLVHCRTPADVGPTDMAVATCSCWLRLEVEAARPRLIVALGRDATRWFLGERTNMRDPFMAWCGRIGELQPFAIEHLACRNATRLASDEFLLRAMPHPGWFLRMRDDPGAVSERGEHVRCILRLRELLKLYP